MKRLEPDDPKLTAYILGELDGRAAEWVESSLGAGADPAVRRAIEETLDVASMVESSYAVEPGLFLTAEQRAAILRGQLSERHFERPLPFRVETFPMEEVARAVLASGVASPGGGGQRIHRRVTTSPMPGRVGRVRWMRSARWAAAACLAVGSAGLLLLGLAKSGQSLGVSWFSPASFPEALPDGSPGGGYQRIVLDPRRSGAEPSRDESGIADASSAAAPDSASGWAGGSAAGAPDSSDPALSPLEGREGLSLDDIGLVEDFVDLPPFSELPGPDRGVGDRLLSPGSALEGSLADSGLLGDSAWLADSSEPLRSLGFVPGASPTIGQPRRASSPEPTWLALVPSRHPGAVAGHSHGHGQGHPASLAGASSHRDRPVGYHLALNEPVVILPTAHDSVSYSNVRRYVMGAGILPPSEIVSVDDLVNYFDYGTKPPSPSSKDPLRVEIEVGECPWAEDHRLVRVSLKAREVAAPRPNRCIFLVNVSDSMHAPERLPMMIRALGEVGGSEGEIALIAYGGGSFFFLESTALSERERIRESLRLLEAPTPAGVGGRTFDEALALARKLTYGDAAWRATILTDRIEECFVIDAGNPAPRIVRSGLGRLAQDSRWPLMVVASGNDVLTDARIPELSVGPLGFAHVSSLPEAERELAGIFAPGADSAVAEKVSVQVEFNPASVLAYRLLGTSDKAADSSAIGSAAPLLPPGGITRRGESSEADVLRSGREVTTLFEVIPIDRGSAEGMAASPLKYQRFAQEIAESLRSGEGSDDLFSLQVRYRIPGSDEERVLEQAVGREAKPWSEVSGGTAWAAAVAGYGMLLREDAHLGSLDLAMVADLARNASGARNAQAPAAPLHREFLDLVRETMVVIGSPAVP